MSTALGQTAKKSLEGLNMLNGTNLTLKSVVEHGTYIFGSHERSLTQYFESMILCCSFKLHTILELCVVK